MKYLAWLSAAALIATACSGSDAKTGSSSSSGGGTIVGSSSSSSSSAGGFSSSGSSSGTTANIGKYAQAYCAHLHTCSPGLFDSRYSSPSDCEAQSEQEAQDAIDNLSGIAYPDAAVAACVAKLGSAPCTLDVFDLQECQFAGTLDDGAACYGRRQCKGLRCRLPSASADCGVCAKAAQKDEGCFGDNDCAFGLECLGANGVQTCQPRLTKGATCSDKTVDCASGLACVSGACTQLLDTGASCVGGDCRAGTFCDGTCKLYQPTIATAGQACPTGTVCRESSCRNGTCLALAKAGQACSQDASAAAPDCDLQSFCSNGTCQKNTFPACQ